MERFPVSARELVARLKEQAADKAGDEGHLMRSTLQNNHELVYLNKHYVLQTHYEAKGSKGPLRAIRALAKALFHRWVTSVMANYFANEREYLANAVRFQNEAARQIDQLYNEINRLHDLFRECRFLAERADSLHQLLELRVVELENARESNE